MRRDEIDDELKDVSFDYFYWFSRFEFALKEKEYLKNHDIGANAEPSWDEFHEKNKTEYVASEEARQLIELHPERQFVAESGKLDWRPVGTSHCGNDLCKVIAMLKTVRNNLFHGGKHGDNDIDSKERNLKLLSLGKVVLDQLARLARFEDDYERSY
jgi:hypothetical protein